MNGAMVPAEPDRYPQEKIDLIKRTVAAGATDDELALFLEQCRRTGLDPFSRQIYLIKRGSGDAARATIQTGIDGYRLIAARTGLHAGTDDVIYTETDKGEPLTASVTVYRIVQGQRVGFTATARMTEYRQDRAPMWQRMPNLMLGKCAEALALRKAFPAELSGIYTDAEMDQSVMEGQARVVETKAPPAPPAPVRTLKDRLTNAPDRQRLPEATVKALVQTARGARWTQEDIRAFVDQQFGCTAMYLTVEEAANLADYIAANPKLALDGEPAGALPGLDS